MFCPYCGYQLKDDYIFCKNCGKRVDDYALSSARDPSKPEKTQTTKTTRPPTPEAELERAPKVQDNASSKQSTAKTTTLPPPPPPEFFETVLAGFTSADMMRPGSMGYGIYITNKRILGVKKPEQFAKALGGYIAGAVIGKLVGFEAPWAVSNALARNLTNDENFHMLGELEKNKDIDINKNDITLVQLKEPFFTQLGYLAIFVHGQQKTETIIKFGKDKTFEMLKEMLKAYFPNVLRTTI